MPERTTRGRPARPVQISAENIRRVTIGRYKAGVLEGDEVVEEEREIETFITEPAYVRVGAGLTKNLGSYESLRVDVSITMPCYREEVSNTLDATADSVSQRLEDELEQYLGSYGEGI